MCNVSAQGGDERMINVHYYYYCMLSGHCPPTFSLRLLSFDSHAVTKISAECLQCFSFVPSGSEGAHA